MISGSTRCATRSATMSPGLSLCFMSEGNSLTMACRLSANTSMSSGPWRPQMGVYGPCATQGSITCPVVPSSLREKAADRIDNIAAKKPRYRSVFFTRSVCFAGLACTLIL